MSLFCPPPGRHNPPRAGVPACSGNTENPMGSNFDPPGLVKINLVPCCTLCRTVRSEAELGGRDLPAMESLLRHDEPGGRLDAQRQPPRGGGNHPLCQLAGPRPLFKDSGHLPPTHPGSATGWQGGGYFQLWGSVWDGWCHAPPADCA